MRRIIARNHGTIGIAVWAGRVNRDIYRQLAGYSGYRLSVE